MRFPNGSSVSSHRRRRFRPALEKLENRLAPALGVFTEDFSDDGNNVDPGFDTAADGLEIVNDLPRHTPDLGGPTGRQGRYNLQPGNPGDPGWGLHADGNILVILSSNALIPQVIFSVPSTGAPTIPGQDEEVHGIGVSVMGFGLVTIIGENGRLDFPLPNDFTWHRIAADRDDITITGDELGAIRQLYIYSAEFVAIDNVIALVAPVNPNDDPLATEDVVLVNREFGVSELFNPIENDLDPDGDPIAYVLPHGQPARGTLTEHYYANGVFRGFTYRANQDALDDPTFREDSFLYNIRDTNGGAATGTVRLIVNTPPVAFFDDYEVLHGTLGPVSIDAAHGLLDNDIAYDGDSLTVRAYGQPQHGEVTVNPDGSFLYTPTTPDGWVLSDSFTYTISDGYFTSHSFARINVPNGMPIASDDFFVIEHEQTNLALLVTANDAGDPDGDPVVPRIATPPQHGTVTVRPDGRIAYFPGDYLVSDTFTYRLADPYAPADGQGVEATVRMLVKNEIPVAVNDEYHSSTGGFTVLARDGVLQNDHDPDGDRLIRITVTKRPDYGTLSLSDNGAFTYSHDEPFNIDTFGYVVDDGIGQSHPATVTLVADQGLPEANSDVYVIEPDTHGRNLDILHNDYNPGGGPLQIDIVSMPSHGELTVGGGALGFVHYDPDSGYEGTDFFVYRVFNASGFSLFPRGVSLQVTDDPDVPVANPDAYSMLHDTTLTVRSSTGLLANDSLLPGPSTLIHLSRPPRFGTLDTLDFDRTGAFTYTPNPGFVGVDDFEYRIDNNVYESEAQTVSITVTNQAPVARSDFFPITPDSYVWGNVLANDHDPDTRDTLRAELMFPPGSQTMVLEPDGDFYFRPGAGAFTHQSFTYRIFDGAGYSEVAEIFVGLQDGNVAYLPGTSVPLVATSTFGTVLEASFSETPPYAPPAGFQFPLGFFSFVIRNVPADGHAAVVLDLPYNAPPVSQYWKFDGHDIWYRFDRDGATGTDFFLDHLVLNFVDGGRGDNDATVNGVIVDPGGPAFVLSPVAADDAYAVAEDETLVVAAPGVLANDSGLSGDPLTAVLISGPAHGSLTLNADGSFNYAADLNFEGVDSFTYRASSATLVSADAVVTLTVNPVNDAPTAQVVGPTQGVRGQPLPFTLNAFDPDFSHLPIVPRFAYRIDWDGDGAVDQIVAGHTGTVVDHVYPAAGRYTVRVQAVDGHGAVGPEAEMQVEITAMAVQVDPLDPSKTVLVIGGSTGNDRIQVRPGKGDQVKVKFMDKQDHILLRQAFGAPIDRIVVYAQAGNDNVDVAGSLSTAAWLDGGDGDDRLKGGSGHDVLLGGEGCDMLIGGGGRDLLIGGAGRDRLVGNRDGDILIAGHTALAQDAALAAVMAEWTSSRCYATRVANLQGDGNGPRANGTSFLKAAGPDATVFDDDDLDKLTGSAGRDWFFANLDDGVLDKFTDEHGNELVDDLD